MAAAAPIISGGFQIFEGFAKTKALRTQAKEQEYQADLQRLAGRQTSAIHRENLNTALNTIEAVRATRNTRDSFGSFARRQKTVDNAAENENNAVLNSNLRADSLDRQAKAARKASIFPAIGGLIGGGSSIASGF